jgi:hypothetical protein
MNSREIAGVKVFVSGETYDEYKGTLQEQIDNLQSKIDKANEILEEILVVKDWEHEGRFRPVKGTTAQDVYKTIVKLNELLETPRRINYELLKEDK